MKLEVGNYVRTNKDIFQIRNNKTFIENKIEYIGVNGRYTCIDINTIKKTSKDIIDILEVGDYVNGIRVTSVHKTVDDNVLIGLGDTFGFSKFDNDYQIKSIVTSQQFESMQYKVD